MSKKGTAFPILLTASLCCLGLSSNAWAQCATNRCDADDIFVGNFGGASNLVRFSRADIAANGNAATGVVIASGFGTAEGLALDFDGTIIVTTRFTGNVERVCRDGSQRAIEANVTLAEGPSYAPNGDLFLNNTGPTCQTVKAPAGVPFGGLTFVPWITTHPANTFCEDTRIAPSSSPTFPGELYVERNDIPNCGFTNPTRIDAFSASVPETFLSPVIPDFGPPAGLPACSFQSLGMAFDSQGDLWIPKWTGPLGMELLEFTAATGFGFSRAVSVTRPGGVPIGNNNLVKVCISPPDPADPLNPGRDTIFVADFSGFLHVVDEVGGATLASLSSNLATPAGVACCDVIVGVPEEDNRRMTGGGSFFSLGAVRFTHGFELHCDAAQGPNNLEINWPKPIGGGSNRFHLESLTSAVCSDDPLIDEKPPVAGFDTYDGTGLGRMNGVSGATISFRFTDAGEPGKGVDLATITITPPPAIGGPPIVVSGTLQKGNQQAHKQ